MSLSITEFRLRRPRSYGAIILGIAVLLWALALVYISSSSYKSHLNDIEWTFWPFAMTLLASAWGFSGMLYVVLGPKFSFWATTQWLKPPVNLTGRIRICLRLALHIILALAWIITSFALTWQLYRALFYFRFH